MSLLDYCSFCENFRTPHLQWPGQLFSDVGTSYMKGGLTTTLKNVLSGHTKRNPTNGHESDPQCPAPSQSPLLTYY